MVSEGSQTNQHPTTSSVTGASNVAVVPAAQIAPRLQETPAAESHVPVQSVPEVKDTPVAVIASSAQPSTSSAVDGKIFTYRLCPCILNHFSNDYKFNNDTTEFFFIL